MNEQPFKIDPVFIKINPYTQDISKYIWDAKYRWTNESESSYADSQIRVIEGIYANDPNLAEKLKAHQLMRLGAWLPAGRIQAGAGTDKAVTLMNCYVDRTIEDSMTGIADALKDAMLTQQQGGGIGMDFSTLRPLGAYLKRTGAVASGPLPFMNMWDSMCETIMSSGDRRGAMMGTMICTHPDIYRFVDAKHTKGRLTNFNMSVLITDAFANAVTEDEDWHLGFGEPRADGKHIDVVDTDEGPWYIYEVVKARDLWQYIIKSTYEYSEPGVIFIDRINEQNNLKYCETISCTNPCGEQPLPPNGACDLGAVNLAVMVKAPFKSHAKFDYTLLRETVKTGVRFLDNVLNVSQYPLEVQRQEAMDKRRIGIGITGLADAFNFLGIRYGSADSLRVVDTIMGTIKETAYRTSMELAKERGYFPKFVAAEYGKGCDVFESLDPELQEDICTYGIRNGVLLTIAPTGTTSLYCGNISSGLEPIFEYEATRKIRQADGSFETHDVRDYSLVVWEELFPGRSIPAHMISVKDLSVEHHLRIQAACQQHVDGSISKTINCPPDISFDEFELVYWDAYNQGCKGCTTFRPSDVRGSILEAKSDEPRKMPIKLRPRALRGSTTKINWPNTDASFYVTINDDPDNDKPFEVFIHSTSSKYTDWTTALTLMISALMRKGEDISFIPEELKKVVSATDSAWINGKFYGSLVALIASVLEEHIDNSLNPLVSPDELEEIVVESKKALGQVCPKCNRPSVYSLEGCLTCMEPDCDFSKCG